MDKTIFLKKVTEILFAFGFVKTKSSINFVAESKDKAFRIVINLQHSQWGQYYYINYGFVFNKEIKTEELNYDAMEGLMFKRLKFRNKHDNKLHMGIDEIHYFATEDTQTVKDLNLAIKDEIEPIIRGGSKYLQKLIDKKVFTPLYGKSRELLIDLGYKLPKEPKIEPKVYTEEENEKRGQAEWQQGSNAFIGFYGLSQKFNGFSGWCQITREHYKDNKEQWDEFTKKYELKLSFFRNTKK